VFSRRQAAGDTSVHLVLVIDWSGSMSYSSRYGQADRLVDAIGEGLAPVKSFRMTAYQYNANVWRVWGTDDGVPAEEALKHTASPAGGTPTGDALDLVITDEFSKLRPEERLLVCSITDGSPDDDTRVTRTVAHWRERGVGILGVNVAATGQQDIDNIIDQYGEEGGLVFDGNILDLADELTEKVGHLLQGAMVGR
jgi:Mg-chelatase subunit ChlD